MIASINTHSPSFHQVGIRSLPPHPRHLPFDQTCLPNDVVTAGAAVFGPLLLLTELEEVEAVSQRQDRVKYVSSPLKLH